jgi:peptidoglycan/LPS O-acetylase OafA/YrhL
MTGADPAGEREGVARAYYPELDGLRFFAFLAVFIFHNGIPQFPRWVNSGVEAARKVIPGLASGQNVGLNLQQNGWAGVQLFFILSGYLITTLLLREEHRYGRISLRSFWVRRALRIQPLYFLTLVLTFFVLPWIDGAVPSPGYISFLKTHLVWFLLYLGNWSMGILGPVPYDSVSILWSVCVEEQFYLLLPIVLVICPRRARMPVVATFIAAAIAGRRLMAKSNINILLFQFGTSTYLDSLFSGVLLALLLDRYPPGALGARVARIVQPGLLIALVFVLCRPDLTRKTIAHQTWDFVILWLLGVGLIATLIVRPGALRSILGYSRLVWLGKISYGLYMFHEIALWTARKVFDAVGWIPNEELLKTILGFALTIVFAAVSYYTFERPFLRRKVRWMRVESRPV